MTQVLSHSGGPQASKCPCIGCSCGRNVVCQMIMPDGQRKTVSACEKHVDWYVARAVTRWIVQTEGQEGVVAHVDGERQRRCCK